MKKFFKLLFGLAVLFFTLVIAAVIVIPMVVSPNDFKPQIIEAVKQQTGRDLSIEGDIGMSVFPNLGFTLGKTELSNAAGFEQKTFARVDAVNIQVALMPLLDKQVEMDEVVLEGLVLNLHRNAQGVTNWEDLASSTKQPAKKADKSKSEVPELAALAIGGVRIENAQMRWQDDQSGQRLEISQLNLMSGPLADGEPVELDFSTQITSAKPKLNASLTMKTVLQADVDKQVFALNNLALTLNAQSEMLPGGKAEADIKAEKAELQMKTGDLSVQGLSLQALGLTVNGSFTGQGALSDQPKLNGRIQVQTFNARDLMAALKQPVPETADPKALTRVGAGFDLAATSGQATLNNMEARLDDTLVKGKLSVANFSQPAYQFDLNIDQIDLDRYLPPPQKGAKPSATQAAPATGAEPALLPVETLRGLNANGTIRIGQLTKSKVKATDVVVKLKANAGNVNIQPSAKLYQGDYNADVTVDARPQIPKLKVDAKLAGVQIEPLLKDMQGEAKLAGRTNATVNVTALGNSETAVKKTLNGNAAFSFEDGALVGVNLAKMIREGMAKLKGQSVAKTNEPEKTDFSELKGTAKITNGVVNNKDLTMKSPLLRVTGAGKADLVKEEVDYLLKTSIVGSLEGQGGKGSDSLKGLTIPVRVTGPFDKPSYTPDLSAALSDSVKQKAKEKIEEQKKGVTEKLGDKLKDSLKGLF